MTTTLETLFGRYFEVVEAETPDLRDAVFRLRYQVYCLETGFEDKHRFPDGRERDHFDESAMHAVVRRRGNDTIVATVRLVPADIANPDKAFPMEAAYPGLLARRGFGPNILPYETTAEISRFAISREFKRRVGEPGTLAGVSTANADGHESTKFAEDRRAQPFIIMGLFLAIVRLSVAQGYTHWVAVMENPLLRLLSRFGIRFTPVGLPITFHGERQPCVGPIHDVLGAIFTERRDVWEFSTESGRLWDPPDKLTGTPSCRPTAVSKD